MKTKMLSLLLLISLLFMSCDSDPVMRVWYGDNGMVVKNKSVNNRNYGRYKYVLTDNFGEILIRTSEEWNVGDTLYINKH